MRYLLLTTLLFSCLAFAKEGEPIGSADVELLEIPPASGIRSAGGAQRVESPNNADRLPKAANSYHSSRSNNKKASVELAAPTSSSTQHRETDLNFLRERAKASADGTGACCLNNGRCGTGVTEKQCGVWRGAFHVGESCPAACQ